MSAPWSIVFMGTPETSAFTLESLLQGPDPVIGVGTQPDRPAGRGQKTAFSPVRRTGQDHGLPVLAPEKLRDPGFLQILNSWHPELIVVVAYGRILPTAILELAPQGCINVHYSLLPKYRGAAPAAWTILNGDTKAGVTTMKLVEKMDAGPIYLQEEVTIGPDETTGSLQTKLIPVGAQLLLDTIRRLKDGSVLPQMQNEADVTFAPMLRKEDGLIDWNQAAVAIERRVRGLFPWPGTYTHLKEKLLKIHRVKIVAAETSGNPGEILRADAGGLWVATSSGIIGLEEVQLENRKRLPGAEFLKGTRVKSGDRFQ
jgi:methionyl-tRNA formyltransferase